MPLLTDAEKAKRDAFIHKEQSKLGNFFENRERKFRAATGMKDIMGRGVKCQENSFANKNSLVEPSSKTNQKDHHQNQTPSATAQPPPKFELKKTKTVAPQPAAAAEESELEIDFGG